MAMEQHPCQTTMRHFRDVSFAVGPRAEKSRHIEGRKNGLVKLITYITTRFNFLAAWLKVSSLHFLIFVANQQQQST
jgi:hypothetical protein